MIKITQNSKIFVYCPAGVVTGGAELLHQLVHELNVNNIEAYIYYFDRPSAEVEVPADYKAYNLRVATRIVQASENVIVLYEAIFDRIKEVGPCQLLLWWLSVDNFFICSRDYLSAFDYFGWDFKQGCKVLGKRLLKFALFKDYISLKALTNLDAVSCYQSEYAQHFLYSKGFREVLPLTDYINTSFSSRKEVIGRENKILYNPKKGFEFTRKIMAAAPHIKWVPLQNMSRQQLIREFQTAKIYIDFGYHPGKDRIPREAALNDCCIITNRRGSAGYFEDVSIYNKYKLSEASGMASIVAVLNEVLENYEECIKDFAFYKERILREQADFVHQVKQIFIVTRS
ncbi:hypothetical protein HGH92_13285 [Chitinophaga varians]|uniref:Glycosyltransferase family 1 protein n=1 Tax=Chitinophaga varians TaxID=2202339 RepID=A0A847RQJ7_9BACT|nr:hypothetical protein [Chitinophaga varians]NLR65286.1 hypothetical protein [Chitinophaga varians]